MYVFEYLISCLEPKRIDDYIRMLLYFVFNYIYYRRKIIGYSNLRVIFGSNLNLISTLESQNKL